MRRPRHPTRRALKAVVVTLALLAAACSADEPDRATARSQPLVTAQAAVGADDAGVRDDAGAGGSDDAGAAGDSDAADADAVSVVDVSAEPADLGEFNGYEPPEPDSALLAVDAEVSIGTLGNGLTYYVRSNDAPAGRLALRLVVNAGAVLDPAGREGTAHFVEHMLFNGTASYSENELVQALRDVGVELGRDVNAYTSPDRTVYRLDVGADDPEAVDVAFGVLSEWAAHATIDPAAVEAERGVVLDEYQLTQQTADGRIGAFLDAVYYRGTVYEGMQIAGNAESIRAITADGLREFYERWYRPDNMAVIVVGDLPQADMAAKVEQHFGALANPAEPMPQQPERDRFTADFVDEPVIDVVTHPEYGQNSMSIDWQLPAWSPATVGGSRYRWMEAVITFLLEVRLTGAHQAGMMAQADEPSMSLWQQARGLRLYGTNIEGRDLRQATTDFLSVLEGAAHYGFTDDEFEQAVAAARTSLQAELEREATVRSAGFADRYVLNFARGVGIESIEERVVRLRALMDGFTVEELTAHLRWILDNAPPLVVSLGDEAGNVPDVADLRAALDAVVPLPPPPAEDPIETLMAAPEPAAPIREHPVGLFEGAHEWVFANGARVVFAPSDLAAGQVDLSAQALGGWSQLPIGSAGMRRAVTAAVAASGVGDYSQSQLDEYLAGTTARLSAYVTELTEGFSGSASPGDLEDLLALMHLYVTEPRVTEVAAGEQVQALQVRRNNSLNNPVLRAQYDMFDAFYQHSPWYRFILTPEEIEAVTAEGLLELYEARLGDVDDLTVVLVGDVDRETVADLAARYIGTLPAGEPDQHQNHNPGFPHGVQRLSVTVDPDSGGTGLYMYFGAAVPVTVETLVYGEIVDTLLDDLLVTGVREGLGETYAAAAFVTPYIEVGLWESYFSATGPSDSLEQINDLIVGTVAELAADGPTEDDLAQAVSVLRDNYRLDANGEIISPLLRRRHLDDALVATPAQRLAVLDRVSADDVARYVSLFFDLDNRIEMFRIIE